MSNDLHLQQATTAVKQSGGVSEASTRADTLFEVDSGASPLVRGIYAHVPFCAHRCHYCDFFTVAGRDDQRPAFVDRMQKDVAATPAWVGGDIETIFVGGGTPTYLAPPDLVRLLRALHDRFVGECSIEFTVEANPETVTREIAEALVTGGVNRVSLGAQSFHPELLHALERRHDPNRVGVALEHLREAGITRTSVDLIFAIPGQDLGQWEDDLARAIDLGTDHLSCYGLVYEPGTPLRGRRDRGEVEPVGDDLEARMYEIARDRLAESGFEQYEISNWARPGHRCRHNLLYWRNENWWPLGPSASGHIEGHRWRNQPRLGEYLEGDGLPAIRDVEYLEEDGRIGEGFMMGLRCLDGLPGTRVEEMLSGEGGERRRPIIAQHVESGLLEWSGDRLRFTTRGLL